MTEVALCPTLDLRIPRVKRMEKRKLSGKRVWQDSQILCLPVKDKHELRPEDLQRRSALFHSSESTWFRIIDPDENAWIIEKLECS
jgi:hypothetical protein